MNCSVHSQPTVGGTSLSNQDLHYPESGKSSLSSDQHTDTVASAADTTNNSTVCLEECTDTEAERAMEWCQYSSIYVVFCSGLDGSSKLPGVTLQDMQELVEGRAAACSEAWNQSFWEDDYEDVGDSENSISSHSNGSVGGALSAVLGKSTHYNTTTIINLLFYNYVQFCIIYCNTAHASISKAFLIHIILKMLYNPKMPVYNSEMKFRLLLQLFSVWHICCTESSGGAGSEDKPWQGLMTTTAAIL